MYQDVRTHYQVSKLHKITEDENDDPHENWCHSSQYT